MTLSPELVTRNETGFLEIEYRGTKYTRVPLKFIFEPIDEYLEYKKKMDKKIKKKKVIGKQLFEPGELFNE
jgi:hypothetical protein